MCARLGGCMWYFLQMATEMKKERWVRSVDGGDSEKYRMKEWEENEYGLKGRCTI